MQLFGARARHSWKPQKQMTRPIACLFGLVAFAWPLVVYGQHHRAGASTGASTRPVPLKGVIVSFHGTLSSLSRKAIVLESDDNRTLTMRRSSKTKFMSGDEEIKASDIEVEEKVTIDASEDVDLKFLAVAVRLDPGQTPKKARGLIVR